MAVWDRLHREATGRGFRPTSLETVLPGPAVRPPANRTARLPRRAMVTASVPLTDTGTIMVTFRVVDDDPFDFAPGQFVAIDHDHPSLGYRRSPYCLYGGSAEDRTFTLLVRVVPQGPMSIFLGDLVPGDLISFRGPSGHSMVPREAGTHLVLLATGVGLGPVRCLLRYLVRHEPRRRVSLYWGLRLEDDICLIDELIFLARDLERFEWEITLSRPGGDWRGMRGRITESVPGLFDTLADKHFYLTCNGAMVAEMSTALREVGVSGDRIYEESFFDHRHKPEPAEIAAVISRFTADDLMTPLTHLEVALGRRRW